MTAKPSKLDEDYLRLVLFSNPARNREEFFNCSDFRASLYILRERLFSFIKETFQEFIWELPHTSRSSIKQAINAKVHTIDPSAGFLQYDANQRRQKIQALNQSQFTADWRTFARCYTWSFLACDHTQIYQSKVDVADPKDLLEILKNCTLFPEDMYTAAYGVIEHRNKCYGHLDVLLIDPKRSFIITQAIDALIKIIPEQHQ